MPKPPPQSEDLVHECLSASSKVFEILVVVGISLVKSKTQVVSVDDDLYWCCYLLIGLLVIVVDFARKTRTNRCKWTVKIYQLTRPGAPSSPRVYRKVEPRSL
eukprot:TRINITY_DN10881_c0_g1_i14.p3 TRINITY_DN10881_c0_g1~~TRINITY_DN10881_c0_g1_i14.p3  ORF type:complete len:103 (-),score=4.03 TRINITY_DN10881_c0_g1_i14:647-955(-)